MICTHLNQNTRSEKNNKYHWLWKSYQLFVLSEQNLWPNCSSDPGSQRNGTETLFKQQFVISKVQRTERLMWNKNKIFCFQSDRRRLRADKQTWLSLSGCFSTHILGRWTSDRPTESWNPSGPMTWPGRTLTTALQSVLCIKDNQHKETEDFCLRLTAELQEKKTAWWL